MIAASTPTSSVVDLDAGVRAIIDASAVSYRDDEWVVDCSGTELRASSQRALAHALAGHVYTAFHAGIAEQDETDFVPALQQDHVLEARLVEASASLRRVERLQVVERTPDAGAVVLLNGVRVFVPGEVREGRGHARIDAELPTLSPRLSIGFLFFTPRVGGGRGGRPLRLYRHLRDADEAVEVWRRLTAWAEESSVALRAKVLSQSWGLPRNDGLVIYLPSESWHRLDEVADAVEGDDDASTSMLARTIRPGVTIAWEPHDLSLGAGRTSFGEHRAGAIARGIVAAAGEPAAGYVRAELLAANVDPTSIHRNLDSPSLEGRVRTTGGNRQGGGGSSASASPHRKEQ